jgi:clan AA aspartic protease
MIIGSVDEKLEATLCLKIYGRSDQEQEVIAVVDTGYNGALTLPAMMVSALALPTLAAREVTLGDTSRKVLDFYRAEIEWDRQRQAIAVLCVEGDPLLGTALLKGYKLEADFVVGGLVQVTTVS